MSPQAEVVPQAGTWHVYVLRARDGRLYTGIATDVARRLGEHESGGGRGAKSLRGRGPFAVAFQRPVGSRALALRVERGVKRLSRSRKEQLLSDGPDLEALLLRLEIDPDVAGDGG